MADLGGTVIFWLFLAVVVGPPVLIWPGRRLVGNDMRMPLFVFWVGVLFWVAAPALSCYVYWGRKADVVFCAVCVSACGVAAVRLFGTPYRRRWTVLPVFLAAGCLFLLWLSFATPEC